jgi:site-specific DNA-methyltransferase (adenine-specific)
MLIEATKLGFYKAGNGKEYPRLQVLTIEDLLSNKKRPEYYDMSLGDLTFKRAEKERIITNQPNLFDP